MRPLSLRLQQSQINNQQSIFCLETGERVSATRFAPSGTMPGMKRSTRDAFWLAVLCLVLGAWGWDRGRLSHRVEVLTENFVADHLDDFDHLVPPGGTFDPDLPIDPSALISDP